MRSAAVLKMVAFTALLAASPAFAQPTPASAELPNPRSAELFESDWVLMNWALKNFDADGNVLLSPAEAQAASDAFRKIADSNGDGRVTPQEYREARAFILARN
jgi:hypothetical protein